MKEHNTYIRPFLIMLGVNILAWTILIAIFMLTTIKKPKQYPVSKQTTAYINGGAVQTVKANPGYKYLCNGCAIMLSTVVWYKQEIIKVWYDDYEKMDSTKIKQRYIHADSLFKSVAKLNN